MHPSPRLSPGKIAVLVTVCAVGIAVATGGGRAFSPGALSAETRGSAKLGGVSSHAELGGKCSACHAPSWSGQTMADRCLACHADVRRQLDTRGALHGRLANGAECRSCHTEHKGPHAPLTDLSTFDHDCAAFRLTGKHATADCKGCHAGNTFKGTPQTCLACHAEPKAHMGLFGTDCAKCHTTANWRAASVAGPASTGSTFNHDLTRFKLTGKHAATDCKACHVNNTFKGTPVSCASCHGEPKIHYGKFGTDCATCHTTTNWHVASVKDAVAAGGKFDHNLTAFKLTGKHTAVDCKACHVNNTFKGTPTSCLSCHVEPKVHVGKFGTDCAKCHTTATWTGAAFKHTFPITHGRKNRADNSCATCHAAADNYKTYTCYGCHEHTPQKVLRQHSGKKIVNLDNCTQCHRGGRGRERADLGGDGCPGCPTDGGLLSTFDAAGSSPCSRETGLLSGRGLDSLPDWPTDRDATIAALLRQVPGRFQSDAVWPTPGTLPARPDVWEVGGGKELPPRDSIRGRDDGRFTTPEFAPPLFRRLENPFLRVTDPRPRIETVLARPRA